MLYTLCYFENYFCLKFVHGEQLFHCKKQLKKRKEKNTRKTHRLMSSVGEKAGLLKLLLCLAFLFFGLLKQVNIAVESKTIGVIFPPFFRFSDFFAPVGQKFSSKNLYRRIHLVKNKNEYEWFGIACANQRYFFSRLLTSRALTFVADLSLILAHNRRQCSKIN